MITTVKYDHNISHEFISRLGQFKPQYATVTMAIDEASGKTEILNVSFKPETLQEITDAEGLMEEIKESSYAHAEYVLNGNEGESHDKDEVEHIDVMSYQMN